MAARKKTSVAFVTATDSLALQLNVLKRKSIAQARVLDQQSETGVVSAAAMDPHVKVAGSLRHATTMSMVHFLTALCAFSHRTHYLTATAYANKTTIAPVNAVVQRNPTPVASALGTTQPAEDA